MLSSVLFPWTIIERIFGTFMTVVQFPERFLMMGVFFLTICSGWAAGEYLKDKNRGAFLALILAVLLIIPTLESIGERPTTMFTGEWAPSLMDTPEYQLQGTDLSLIRERTVESNPSVVVSKYERFGTGARGHLQAYEQGTVVLPIFAFDQYQLHIGDQKVSYVRGNNNRVTFNVQAGTDTDFVLLYCIPLRWRCADAISVLSLLVLIWKACSVGRSKRYPYHETGYNSIEA